MIIILEGPDGSGKTTLGKALTKKLGARYIHASYKFPSKMFTYQTAIMHEAMRAVAKGQPVIIDRLWISEAIYAEVFRGGSPWPLMGRYFERLLYKVGGFYMYCEPPENYRQHYAKLKDSRAEMYDDVDKIVKVARMYENFVGHRTVMDNHRGYLFSGKHGIQDRIRRYSISRDGKNIDEYVDSMAYWVEMEKDRYPFLDDENLTGNFHGKIMLIGDELAPSRKGKLGWPFHAYVNSSLYLTEKIHEIGFRECDLCYTNINEKTGVRNVGAWIGRHYHEPHLAVVMGRWAERTYLKHFGNRSHLFVVHPQAARRFPKYDREFTGTMTELYNGIFYQGVMS